MTKSLHAAFDRGVDIDLHDRTVKQAMEEFVLLYNTRLSQRRKGPIRVIHGGTHGDRIRTRLRHFLAEHKDKLDFELGKDVENNDGLTLVWPELRLPTPTDLFQARILEYCRAAKTRDKIISKFWRSGETQVVTVIEGLVDDGDLIVVHKSGLQLYQATKQG